MIEVYRKIFDLLDPKERTKLFVLIGIMIATTFAEILGISTLLVLLGVLSDPGKIVQNPYLNWAYETFGFTSFFAFQVALSGAVMLVVLAGLAVKAAGAYAIIRFSAMRGYRLSSRLLAAYLHQPYSWFLERNSSDISKSVLHEVGQLVNRALIPSLRLLTSLLLSVSIVIFLFLIDPVVALATSALVGGGYGVTYLLLRDKLKRLGQDLLVINKERFRLVNEASGGAKDVKLMGLEDSYVKRFDRPARQMAELSARNDLLRDLPRFVLEGVTFAILIGIVLLMLFRSGGDMVAIVPTLGIFTFAAMRLLPALQQIYHSLASLRGGQAVLNAIHADHVESDGHEPDRPFASPVTNTLPLVRDLALQEINYSYPTAERGALNGLSLHVKARSTIGIVGGTGAGKTTLVDLILGLLVPDSGQILVDGIPLDRSNLRAWQRTLGYVPQSIYLTDDSVARNIAFGVSDGQIDMAAVERAARTAALHDFVMEEMPQGYETIVGERGVRLSGGQRQRIGIARALYHNPSLLILDEATSALDNLTERTVMEAVQRIRKEKTIILIAHRLSTVRNCDEIHLIEQGRVVSSGTYDELVAKNETFRRMVANG